MFKVKEFSPQSGVFTFSNVMSCKTDSPTIKVAIGILEKLMLDIGIVIETKESAGISFKRDYLLEEEAFKYEVCENRITINYADPAGARNAVITLYNHIKKDGENFYLACGNVFDYPDCAFRAALIDTARKYLEPREIKASIKQLAMAKMNKIIFHLMDTRQLAFVSDAVPELNNGSFRQYTKNQMRDLVAYAKSWGIEMIPSINFPAHCVNVLKNIPELGCKVSDDKIEKGKCFTDDMLLEKGVGHVDGGDYPKSEWAICVGNDKHFEIAEKLYKEAYEMFESDYMMICGDELAFWDLGFWPNWEHCECCKAVAKAQGFENAYGLTEYFYYHIRKIHAILSKLGKKIIMASDNIDVSKTPDLPRDITIFWWRPSTLDVGIAEGRGMERFLEEGFDVINCYYEDTYIDLYMTAEKLTDWNPMKRPLIHARYKKQVKGACICAWEGQNHYLWSLPTGFTMFGEKLWDYKDVVYDEAYNKCLTKYLLGPNCPENLDTFSLLGGPFFPLDADMPAENARKGWAENVGEDALPQINKTIALLIDYANLQYDNSYLACVYSHCLNWMKNEIEARERN